MYQKHDFEILPISALEKVRGHIRPQLFEKENSALFKERFGFQVAYLHIYVLIALLLLNLTLFL